MQGYLVNTPLPVASMTELIKQDSQQLAFARPSRRCGWLTRSCVARDLFRGRQCGGTRLLALL